MYANFAMITMDGCNTLEAKLNEESGVFHFLGKIAPLDYSNTYERELEGIVPQHELTGQKNMDRLKRFGFQRVSDGKVQDYAMVWLYRLEDEHTAVQPMRRSFLLGCQLVNLNLLVNASDGVHFDALHSCFPIGVRCKVVKPCSESCRALNQPVWQALEAYAATEKEAVQSLGRLTNSAVSGWKTAGGILRNSFFLCHDVEEADCIITNTQYEEDRRSYVKSVGQAIDAMKNGAVYPSVANFSGPMNELLEMQQKLIHDELAGEFRAGKLALNDELGEPFFNLRTMQQYGGSVTSFTDMNDVVSMRAATEPVRKRLTSLWVAMRLKGYHTLTVEQLANKDFTASELIDLHKMSLNIHALNGVQSQYFSDYVPQGVQWHFPPRVGDHMRSAACGLESHAVMHDGIVACIGHDGYISLHGEDRVIKSGLKGDAICVSPNGSMLARACGDTVTLHRLQHKSGLIGDAMASHAFGSPVQALAFSWNGMALACSTGSGVHHAEISGAPVGFDAIKTVDAAGDVASLAFSPCGHRLACGPAVRTLDLRAKAKALDHGGKGGTMAFTQNGDSLITACVAEPSALSSTNVQLCIVRDGKTIPWGSVYGVVRNAKYTRATFSTRGTTLTLLERDGNGDSHISSYNLFPESCGPNTKFMYGKMKDGFVKTSLAMTEDQRQMFTGPSALGLHRADDCESLTSLAIPAIKCSESLSAAMRSMPSFKGSAGARDKITLHACEDMCRKIPSLKGDCNEAYVRALAMHAIIDSKLSYEFQSAIGSAGAPNLGAKEKGQLAGHCYATMHYTPRQAGQPTQIRLLESTCAVDCRDDLTREEADAVNKLCAVVQMLTRTSTCVPPELERMMSAASVDGSFWKTLYVSGDCMLGYKATLGRPVPTYGVSAADFVRSNPNIAKVKVNYDSAVKYMGGNVDSACIKRLAVELCMVQKVAPWTKEQWDSTMYSPTSMASSLHTRRTPDQQVYMFCHQFATEKEAAAYCKHINVPGKLAGVMKQNLLDTKYHAAIEQIARHVSVEQVFTLGTRAAVICNVPKASMPQAVQAVDNLITMMHSS